MPSPVKLLLILSILTLFTISSHPVIAQTSAPVYVTLWFDTEDYVLPQSDDAAKRLAETLTRLGVRATFKIVGEKARTLEQRGRKDVIVALKKHEIGYHANTHSGQPTIAVYLQHTGWEDGAAEFYRREVPGVKDIERIFGVTPTCYGQPGSAWASQTYPALKQMGIGMYLDEGSHVGIDDQPFYYGGMLNVFKMRSTVARMELRGGESLATGKAKFQAAYDKLRAAGGGTISIYYHPCEWVHTEFWDGVNFRRGANPPRSEWKLPGVRPAAETEKAFSDFEEYVKFVKAQPGVRFVTANDLMKLYPDRALQRSFSRNEILALARAAQQEITFQKLDGFTLSAADAFALLNEAMLAYVEKNALPPDVKLTSLYGPARQFNLSAGKTKPASLTWPAFAAAVRDVSDFTRTQKRMPDAVWFGVDSLSPQDYLATLAAVIEELIATGKKPEQVKVREGKFTADQYVAEDSTRLWGWVIFPEGFQAPKIMGLARLQAWTLKPAILQK
jgi:hypothetical protein